MLIQLIKHMIYLMLCEFIELAIINRRTRQLDATVHDLARRARQADEYRWN